MAREQNPLSDDEAELLKQFQASISGLNSDQLRGLLPHLAAASGAMPGTDPFGRAPVPSRRRAKRDDVVTYQVRVDLTDTKPPLWRRLELSSDLTLDEVHDILQIAFGWTDSHLHEFASGKDYYDRLAEHYLCPFEVDEGETGVPEQDVRLDEILAKPGDRLWYLYDFGDGWMHSIKLESERPRGNHAPKAVCLDGRRPGPSEDCGGVHGYESTVIALDPDHPEHATAVAEYQAMYGEDADPTQYAPTPFDLDAINESLADPGAHWQKLTGVFGLPGPLGELAGAIRFVDESDLFQQWIKDADLDGPIDIDADAAATMVSPYTWLLDRVGVDGIKLTGAGFLPPADVEAAWDVLGAGERWIGKGNRENHTPPVLQLRESAQSLGLLRKYRGTLLLTKRGHELRNDPLALWWYLAERTPSASKNLYDTHAGLILLTALAAGSDGGLYRPVAEILDALGWRQADGTRMTPATARYAALDTSSLLQRLGALTDEPRVNRRSDLPTLQGALFARATLRTWPGGS
jgi:hypothetical protein